MDVGQFDQWPGMRGRQTFGEGGTEHNGHRQAGNRQAQGADASAPRAGVRNKRESDDSDGNADADQKHGRGQTQQRCRAR